MFLRKRRIGDKTYWSLVRSYRKDGKVKQESLGIGRKPTLNIWRGNADILKLLTDEEKEKIYPRHPELKEEYKSFLREKYPRRYCSFRNDKYCMSPPVHHIRVTFKPGVTFLKGYCEKHKEKIAEHIAWNKRVRALIELSSEEKEK